MLVLEGFEKHDMKRKLPSEIAHDVYNKDMYHAHKSGKVIGWFMGYSYERVYHPNDDLSGISDKFDGFHEYKYISMADKYAVPKPGDFKTDAKGIFMVFLSPTPWHSSKYANDGVSWDYKSYFILDKGNDIVYVDPELQFGIDKGHYTRNAFPKNWQQQNKATDNAKRAELFKGSPNYDKQHAINVALKVAKNATEARKLEEQKDRAEIYARELRSPH